MRAKSVYVVGEINHESLNRFLEAFPRADAKPGPIFVYIMSEGGDVDIGIAMYELLRTAVSPIITVGVGAVCSMAVLLLQAGDHRVITQSTSLLIHDGTVAFQGALHSTKLHMDQSVKTHAWYCQQIVDRSGIPMEKAMELARTESFLSATEALELGLVDEVRPYRDHMTFLEEEENESASCCPCSSRPK
jgi:ATP-dependent Clp protease protease subunit